MRRLGRTILALVVILLAAGFLVKNALKPDYDGEQELEGLSAEVTVHYDEYGVPHIYGSNEKDAFRALGYVHAQDRLWQMELLRRIASGGLSEVFGKDVLETDRFFLSLGIDDASQKSLSKLNKEAVEVQISQAYLDGINQFIANGATPIEYYLTGLEKKPFSLRDVYNTMGYMAFSFAQAHKTDPLLSEIESKLGAAYLKDLEIDIDPNTTLIKTTNGKKDTAPKITMSASVIETLESLAIPLFEGSNSWVIGPDKTKNGKVLFANDPHIGFSQPSVWYEAHVATPTYEKYGYHLAGVPYPVLGHDRNIAYGMTMFENDDTDFYYEEQHPTDTTKYKKGSEWLSYEIVEKTIKVKGQEDAIFRFKKTVNGPVLNGIAKQIKGERPISMSWVYTDLENKVFSALHGISHAKNLEEFQISLKDIHAPGLNIMYGDAEGNVAWWATAKLFNIPDSLHTKFIFEHDSGFSQGREYLPFSENPMAINPPYNYVYSANNQPDSVRGRLYPGYYLPENRAKRIVDLLEPRDDWDKEAMGKMITDVTSSVNPSIVTSLGKSFDVGSLTDNQLKLLDELNNWKGDYQLESVAATMYHRWIYQLLKNTFEDELDLRMFTEFLSTHLHKRVIAPMAANSSSVWWDDVSTEEVLETQAMIVQKSYVEAFQALEAEFGQDTSKWTWDKVHTIEYGHAIGQAGGLLRKFFNRGPYPIMGGKEVLNNLAFNYDGSNHFKVSSGPSTRRVVDFSDIENGMSILPTGQSGNPFSEHYDDQAEMYVKGEFRKMMMNKEEILEKSKSHLKLVPASQ